MPEPVAFSRRTSCRICGYDILLALHKHLSFVASASGERRYYHPHCIKKLVQRDFDPDLAA